MVNRVADWNNDQADLYVDIRAKAKPERTPEVVEAALEQTSQLLASRGLSSNIRLELYTPTLQYSKLRTKL